MPRNGSGSYVLPQPAFVPNTTISSAAVNSDFSDIATALTGSVSADGQTSITGQLKFPAGSAAAPSVTFGVDLSSGLYYNSSKILSLSTGGVDTVFINGNNAGVGNNGALLYYGNGAILNPVGMVTDWAGAAAPAGWQLCYGQAISRTGYPELFTIIGTTYGSGDGSTTYNLPDLRGRATYGVDNMGGTAAGRISVAGDNFDGTVLGSSGGYQNQTLSQANLPNVAFAVLTSVTGTASSTVSIPSGQGSHAHALSNSESVLSNWVGGTFFGPVTGGGNLPLQATSIAASTLPGMSGTASGTISGTGTGNAYSGGGNASFSVLSPAFILNKIIFAGRP